MMDQRWRSRREEKGRDYIHWCFADRTMADRFREEFG